MTLSKAVEESAELREFIAGSEEVGEIMDMAYALEGMEHDTYYGKVVMRADDHQLYQPMFISTMVKAGTDKVKFDVEKTGLGWRTDMRVETETTMRPTVCEMKRPKK